MKNNFKVMGMKKIIQVKVKTKSKNERIMEKEGQLIIEVKEAPIDNKANIAIINLIAKYYRVPKKNIKIIKGVRNKNKIIEILFNQ